MTNGDRRRGTSLRSRLFTTFRAAFGGPAGHAGIVRVPGRANLIGDHIDYAGFDVLPFAIPRHIHVLWQPRLDRSIRIVNTDPAHAPVSFEVAERIASDTPGAWGNYARAAVQGLFGDTRTRGFDAVVASDLPSAAGLSSSSALVVATALVYLRANATRMQRSKLAVRLAEAERYVGTQGGGMDQAVCLLARHGHASRIAFNPLHVAHIAIPASWRFVIASSLERAEKSGPGATEYNLRAAEAKDALARVTSVIEPDDRNATTLEVPNWKSRLRAHGARAILDTAARELGDMALRRCRHVLTEAVRVEHACAAIEANDMDALGRLMDASHASLRDDCQVSTAAVDELTSLLRSAGAAGARLTGAGFGGCAIGLCTVDTATRIVEQLRHAYYAPRGVTAVGDSCFVAEPTAGARHKSFR